MITTDSTPIDAAYEAGSTLGWTYSLQTNPVLSRTRLNRIKREENPFDDETPEGSAWASGFDDAIDTSLGAVADAAQPDEQA